MIGPVWFGFMLDHGMGKAVFASAAACFLVAIATVLQVRRTTVARAAVTQGRAMDLGIAGKRALVCAASKGLGRGCAEALAREGVDVTICARTEADVKRAAEAIGAGSGPARRVGRVRHHHARRSRAVLDACPSPDILVTNAGGPPPGDFRDWNRDAWIKAIDANMLTPIELMKATVDGMIARKFGRIVNITSGAVKAPIDVLGLSNGARSGLTGFVAGLARKVAQHGVTINNLLPGTVRHRPPARDDRDARQGAGHSGSGSAERHARGQPDTSRRHAGRVRRDVRVPVQRARRLHRRPERPDGRRPVPGDVLASTPA
jgi:3-oxoacyl-[acyl-carrier protein] reductase